MLIEFKVENFRSFREEQTFSMVAATYAEHLNPNTVDPGSPGVGRILRTAAIYGPNAAGKTNLLRAIQFVQSLVIAPPLSNPIPLHNPFKLAAANRDAPSKFRITFLQEGNRYEYSLSLGAGVVLKECLIQYATQRGRVLFERTHDQEAESGYTWQYSSYLKGQKDVWSKSTKPDALFLSVATQLNSKQLKPVFDWFKSRLVIIVGVTQLNAELTFRLLDQPDGKESLIPFLQEADLNIADMAVRKEPVPPSGMALGGPRLLVHVAGEIPQIAEVTFSHPAVEIGETVEIDLVDESSGTQVLFRSAGAWLNVLNNCEVLVYDEIETSLHPLLIKYLIARFQQEDQTGFAPQLIFTTHNTSLLDPSLLRRDQVWFIERGPDGASNLYGLSEFSPRPDENLERWYVRGKYGALPIVGPRDS